MRNLIITVAVLTVICIFGCNQAQAHSFALEGHGHYDDNNREKYDYGLFSDFIKKDVIEVKGTKTSIGLRTTYEVKRDEVTALVGTITEF
jgi:hypothetical protein